MEFLRKNWIGIYWLILLTHCIFLYYHLPYVGITKLLLVPTLILYLLSKEHTVEHIHIKILVYIGLVFAFVGDMLLIIINDTFFLSGMIAFIITLLCYGSVFFGLNSFRVKSWKKFLLSCALLFIYAALVYLFLEDGLGAYRIPVIVYMVIMSLVTAVAIDLAGNERFSRTVRSYFVPATLVFIISNTLLACNRFHFHSSKEIYICVMLTYGIAQYLFAKGFSQACP